MFCRWNLLPLTCLDTRGLHVGEIANAEIAEPHRPACRQPPAHASQDAVNEPDRACRCGRRDVSTNTEVRARNEPHQCQPTAADCSLPPGADFIFLRRSAGTIEGNGSPASAFTRLCLR